MYGQDAAEGVVEDEVLEYADDTTEWYWSFR
jgi:hypothetical protein